MNPKIIALYLPQYYPFKENNEWWGPGFTEWTNVGKAKPLFKGHYQPKVPADLSYYDLRLPIVREQQAQLAREAGISAFCYWHYWFGNGKRLLADVFQEVLESQKPDFPFCLGWANHSWYAKTWDKDSKQKDKLLMEQTYPGEEDARMHFDFLLKAFNDHRYVKVGNKPFLYIFDSKAIPSEYITMFNKWAIEAGFDGLYLVANISITDDYRDFIAKGFEAVVVNRILYYDSLLVKKSTKVRRAFSTIIRNLKSFFSNKPSLLADYSKIYNNLVTSEEYNEHFIPQIIPGWDHSPRSGNKGLIYYNNTPDAFYLHCKAALNSIEQKDKNHQIVLLKSWNEWGEGNYMEPDIKFGKSFISALRMAIEDKK